MKSDDPNQVLETSEAQFPLFLPEGTKAQAAITMAEPAEPQGPWNVPEPPSATPAITVKSSAPVIKGGHRILPKTSTNKLATENLEHPGYACD